MNMENIPPCGFFEQRRFEKKKRKKEIIVSKLEWCIHAIEEL
jgi:hypothetical protein